MTDTSQKVKTVDHAANETATANELPESVTRDKIIIDPEFQKMFSGKTEDEYEALKEDIRERGILDKLKVWKEKMVLLDGHTRFKIHKELGLKEPLPIERLSFPSRDTAEMWMIQFQLTRRNLNQFQKIEIALKCKDFHAAKAKENQEAGVRLNSDEGVDVLNEVAKLSGSARDTVWKVTKILEKKDNKEVAEYIDALRKGAEKVSIHGVYLECCKKDKVTSKPRPPKQVELSKGLKEKVKQTLGHFTTLTGEFLETTDGIYICDQMIEWAKERKAKIKAAKKGTKKAKKKSSKKSAKKRTKKGTKKVAEKSSAE